MNRKILAVVAFCILSVLAIGQSCDCKSLTPNQAFLELNGNNNRLIDNALRLFDLTSIGTFGDSLLRIWILEDDYPDTPTTNAVKMFEIGKKMGVPFAKLYSMSWRCINDSTFPVKCVTVSKYYPDAGWNFVNERLQQIKIPLLFDAENNKVPRTMRDWGMVTLQFLYGQTTKTIDFTDSIDLYEPLATEQSEESKRFVSLLLLIDKYFDIRLSKDSKGRDFLKREPSTINRIPEVLIKRKGN
jgi:hypothetical protein